MLRTSLLLLAAFFYTSPALAAWGENWGVMVWGAAPSAVPSIDGLGLGLLLLVLIGLAIRGLRSRATLGLMVLASFVGAADLAEAQVTIPNTFTNGEVADAGEVNANFSALADALDVTVPNSFANSGIADANQVNSNFDVLKTAVDTFTNDLAAATSATETAFTNGSIQGVASVDITTDNAAVCTTAGGTYDAGTDSCSVDITTDNAAAEAVAAAEAAAAAGSAACTQAGGTWDAGTSTCTPAYNCFIGGFCSQAAIDFPPNIHAYDNAYKGHTQTTEPAIGFCFGFPPNGEWHLGATWGQDMRIHETIALGESVSRAFYQCASN
ncbi:hypothetical protein N8077_04625 [Myxococcota bacterium]|nr:hypothetical protein [Myxococcota bacterium]